MRLHGGPHDGTTSTSTRDQLVLYANPLFTWKGHRDFAIYNRDGDRFVFEGIERRQERNRRSVGRVMAAYYDGLEIPGA